MVHNIRDFKSTHEIHSCTHFYKLYEFTNIPQYVFLSAYQLQETTENTKMKKCRILFFLSKELKILMMKIFYNIQ